MVVYKITNLVNGKGYIGLTKQPLARRWASHLSRARHGDNRTIYKAIRKHGQSNFMIEQVASAESYEELKLLEQRFISEQVTFAPLGFGYNETLGGEGTVGIVVSAERRARHSQLLKGRKATDATRALLSQLRTGRTVSQETREKIRASLSGRKRPEVGAKISLIQRGRKQSQESKLKRSIALKGRPRSEETKQKISQSHRLRLKKGNHGAQYHHCGPEA